MCIMMSFGGFGQNIHKFYIHVGTNLTLPSDESSRSTFPIIAYNDEFKPSLLLGGFNAGITYNKHLSDKKYISAVISLARHSSWEEAFPFTDNQGLLYGFNKYNKVDYVLKVLPIFTYALTPRLTLGIGFGGNISIISISALPDVQLFGIDRKGEIAINKYNRLFNPLLPVEIRYHLKKIYFGARFEYGPFNTNRSDIKEMLKSKNNYVCFELGFKLK